jgi:hypothetical protein
MGSAAHSVLPTLHQDVALCFEDAAVLCKVFAQEGTQLPFLCEGPNMNILSGATPAALESWVARRYKRVFDVQRLSSELVSSAQAPSGLRVTLCCACFLSKHLPVGLVASFDDASVLCPQCHQARQICYSQLPLINDGTDSLPVLRCVTMKASCILITST